MFATIEGKVGSRRYLWCFHAAEVVFVLPTDRAHDVPEGYLGQDAAGMMVVDRYQAYQAIDQVKRGAIVLAFGRAHRKRDFQKVGDRGGPRQAVGGAGLKIVRGATLRGMPAKTGRARGPTCRSNGSRWFSA